jgi:hypothetical protein
VVPFASVEQTIFSITQVLNNSVSDSTVATLLVLDGGAVRVNSVGSSRQRHPTTFAACQLHRVAMQPHRVAVPIESPATHVGCGYAATQRY